jgi:hypothetical protein
MVYSGNTIYFFMVLKINAHIVETDGRIFSVRGITTNDRSPLSFTITYKDSLIQLYRGPNNQLTYNGSIVGGTYLITGGFDGTRMYLYINGVLIDSIDDINGNFSLSQYAINAQAGSTNFQSSQIDYAEFLAYTTAPTDIQRQTIEGYLAWKWGLQSSLPDSHFYKNISPYKQALQYNRTISIPSSVNSRGFNGRIINHRQFAYYTFDVSGVDYKNTLIANYGQFIKNSDNTYQGMPRYDASATDMSFFTSSDFKYGSGALRGGSLRFAGTSYTGSVRPGNYFFGDISNITFSTWVKFESLDPVVPRTLLSLNNATTNINLTATTAGYSLTQSNGLVQGLVWKA